MTFPGKDAIYQELKQECQAKVIIVNADFHPEKEKMRLLL